uniref:Putative receptor-activated Ca2+permeable cation channel n=1 Tax=Moniliophthora roreri TaxID=221103 RepID=A0A0W0FZM0_MONRR
MSELQPLLSPQDIGKTPVYPTIHMIRADIIHFIDTPLTYEALTAPDLTYTLIRPLVEKYAAIQRDGNMSVVFCFLLNRVHFYRDKNLTTHSISRSRAELCEILAIRTLREYGNDLMSLALALTTSWPVYNGAEESVMRLAREEREDLEERVGNAIEMAILGKAKRFIKSSACQKVIDSIWSGKIVYQAQSSHSILSDTYKRNPIHFYDPHKAPLLDHYRLKVPSIRSVLEYTNFMILFVLFILAIEMNETDRLNESEIFFMVYALGFTLEKVAAMQEHGIKVYFKGTWNGFDLAFVTFYCLYAFLRLYGVFHHKAWARSTGIDCLALIACLMFPRLAFVTLKNNLMVLSLRAMMVQFLALMLIAAFCFGGFLYALWTLSRNEAQYTAGTIAWWMLDLWFGLDASGFDHSTEFHHFLGPILMVTYACLSNTLLLTVLVSILSNTFATINEDAAAEESSVYDRRGKSGFLVFLPTSNQFNRCLHHVATKLRPYTAVVPQGFYDTVSAVAERAVERLPRSVKRLSLFEGLAGSDADIDAIFEIEDELNTSALDTRDDPETSLGRAVDKSPQPQHRRTSSSFRKSNFRSTEQNNSMSSNEAQVRLQPTLSPSTPPQDIIPRQRLNSILHKGAEAAQSFTSPLAQIFQPLVVDDPVDSIDTEGSLDQPQALQPSPSTTPGGSGPPLVSYGPASRRRLSSIQGGHRRVPSEMTSRVVVREPQRSQSQRKQGAVGSPIMEDGAKAAQGVLSESPPPIKSPSLPTVGQVLGEVDTDSAQTRLNQKLEAMEARQTRIEDLLKQISKDLATLQR